MICFFLILIVDGEQQGETCWVGVGQPDANCWYCPSVICKLEKKKNSKLHNSIFILILNIFKLLHITQLHQYIQILCIIYFCIWHYWFRGFLRCHFTSLQEKLVPDHRVRLVKSRTNLEMLWKLNQITNVHMAKRGPCFTCLRACAWNWSLAFGRWKGKTKTNKNV